MSDSLVLERLREIRAIVGDLREDFADLRLRFGAMEANMASMSVRLDRHSADLEWIKRRLDLVETEG